MDEWRGTSYTRCKPLEDSQAAGSRQQGSTKMGKEYLLAEGCSVSGMLTSLESREARRICSRVLICGVSCRGWGARDMASCR